MQPIFSRTALPNKSSTEAHPGILLNELHVGVLVQALDGCVLWCNPAACGFLRLTENQLLGRVCFDARWNVVHEDGTRFSSRELPVAQAISTRMPVNDIAMGVYRPASQDRIWLLVNSEPQLDPTGKVEQIVCTLTDITERKRAEEALRQSEQAVAKQTEERFSMAFHASPGGMAIMRISDNQILDMNESYLQIVGYSRDEVIGHNSLDVGFWVDETERAKLVAQLLEQGFVRDWSFKFRKKSGEVGVGLASVELITVDTDLCALTLLLDMTAREVLEATRAREHLLYLASVRSLAATVDARDAYTHSHSQQVAFYCSLITTALNLPADEAETIELAGLLHDIGKIAIPDTILQKPSRLTAEEWKIMKTHAARGADILSAGNSPVLAPIVPMVRSHHERWGGYGYPDDLSGDEVPFGALVIAVADAFDTITTARPYKAAETLEAACAELKRATGSQFKPEVADAFLRVIERDIAAGAEYIQAIARGQEPGISVLPRIASAPDFATTGPQSLSYQEQQRLAAHMRSLYAIARGFEGATDEDGLVQAAAALAQEHLGAESLYLLELQDEFGVPIGPGTGTANKPIQVVARWGWHITKPFRPFVLLPDGMLHDQQSPFHSDRPLAVPDVRAVMGPDLMPIVEDQGWRSGVYIPMKAGGQPIGVLAICFQSSYRTFTAQDMELVDALSAEAARMLAGIGLRRAEANLRSQIAALEEANRTLARRNRDLAVISEISGRFAAIRDAVTLCRQVVEVLVSNFGYSYVGVALREGDMLHFHAWLGYSPVPDPPEIAITSGIVGRVARTGIAALVPDVTADPDYVTFGAPIRSEICVPLVGSEGVLGVINVESTTLGSLGEVDLQFLTTLAPPIAVALENIRLHTAVPTGSPTL